MVDLLRGTIFEKILREAVQICIEECVRSTVKQNAPKSEKNELQGTSDHVHKHPRLIAVKDWEARHGYPKASGLRHLMFYGKRNGFDMCVRRIGRRVLIDEEKYFEWVKSINESREPQQHKILIKLRS